MQLKEIRKGIYSLDGFNPDNRNTRVVAVHPYFKIEKRSSEYLGRFDHLVRTHIGPIITLEEAGKLESTAERFAALGRTSGAYFIKTKSEDPEPCEIKWRQVVNFIKHFTDGPVIFRQILWLFKEYEGPRIDMVGGYFQDYRGCLGHTALKLKKKRLPIHVREEITF